MNRQDTSINAWTEAAGDGLAGDLPDEYRTALKAELAPGERALWTGRAGPPPTPTIAVFPAFFAAVLVGLSGFALTVLFGIYGLREMGPAETLFFFGLAPGAIGFLCVVALAVRGMKHLRAGWRRSRTFYALTDRRAIVGSDARVPGQVDIGFFTREMFDDTLCIANQDGSGDVFFVNEGDLVWPDWGFLGISRSKHVEGLVRQGLLGKSPRPDPEDWAEVDRENAMITAGE